MTRKAHFVLLMVFALQFGAQAPGQVRGMIMRGGPQKTENIPADIVLETGHAGPITAIAFSPDARYLASASEDRNVILWDPKAGNEEARFTGHAAPVRSIAFSPDGTILASGADDGSIKLWDVEKRSLIRTLLASSEPVLHLAISRDAKYLIAAAAGVEAGSVRLWDLSSGTQAAMLKLQAYGVTAVFFTVDGKAAVATEGGDMELRGTLEVFEVPSGRGVSTSEMLVRAVTPDGRWMAVQHGQWTDASVAVLDKGTEVARFAAAYAPAAFSPDGEWIATIGDQQGSVVVRRALTGEPAGAIHGQAWTFEGLAVSVDGSVVATAGRFNGIQLWNASDGTPLRTLDHRPNSASFAWTRDSRTIITAGSEILYWDIATRKPVAGPTLSGGGLGMAISPDGNLVALGGRNLQLVDRRSGTIVRRFTGPCDVLPNPAFSPDSRLVAGNCRGIVTVWDVASGAERLRVGEHNLLDAGAVSFSPDGRFLVASAGPGHVSVYRANAPGAALDLPVSGGLVPVAFSPDGRRVALGTVSGIRLEAGQLRPVPGQRAVIAVFDLATGTPVFTIPAEDWVSALAFSEDGRTLMAALGPLMQPGQVLDLDASSGRVLRTIVEKVDHGNSAAFSPDRAWFAVAGSKLWKIR